MEHNDKIKKAFWITEDMDREIDAHLKLDNCSSRSEFVMNALKFYVGYLNTKNASAFLPEVLSATLTGTLDGFAGRISSLLFKQGVDKPMNTGSTLHAWVNAKTFRPMSMKKHFPELYQKMEAIKEL